MGQRKYAGKSISEISFPQHSSQAPPPSTTADFHFLSTSFPSLKVSYPGCFIGLGMYTIHPSIHCNTAAAQGSCVLKTGLADTQNQKSRRRAAGRGGVKGQFNDGNVTFRE